MESRCCQGLTALGFDGVGRGWEVDRRRPLPHSLEDLTRDALVLLPYLLSLLVPDLLPFPVLVAQLLPSNPQYRRFSGLHPTPASPT